MIKTTLYFGSFNPVHTGHLIVANYVLQHSDTGELWFVPTPENPLKNKKSLASYYDRYKMLELALESFPLLSISDIERSMPKPNYTCLTLEKLSSQHPNRDFALLIGSDIIEELPRWKNYEHILKYYRLLVYPRPSYSFENPYSEAKITFLKNAPQMEISSSFIRSEIKMGHNILPLVPKKAIDYIKKEGLYL